MPLYTATNARLLADFGRLRWLRRCLTVRGGSHMVLKVPPYSCWPSRYPARRARGRGLTLQGVDRAGPGDCHRREGRAVAGNVQAGVATRLLPRRQAVQRAGAHPRDGRAGDRCLGDLARNLPPGPCGAVGCRREGAASSCSSSRSRYGWLCSAAYKGLFTELRLYGVLRSSYVATLRFVIDCYKERGCG